MLRLAIPSINKVIAWNRKIWLQSCGHVTALIERCLRCLFTGSKQTGVKKAGTTLGDRFSQVPVVWKCPLKENLLYAGPFFYFHWSGKNVVIICSRALYGLKAGFHFKL